MTTPPEFLIQLYHLLIGTVFVLGFYVVGGNLKRTIRNKEQLLPLHVWMISVSYLIMVATFLHPKTNYTWYIFGFRFAALLMGIYALWVLVKFQQKQRS